MSTLTAPPPSPLSLYFSLTPSLFYLVCLLFFLSFLVLVFFYIVTIRVASSECRVSMVLATGTATRTCCPFLPFVFWPTGETGEAGKPGGSPWQTDFSCPANKTNTRTVDLASPSLVRRAACRPKMFPLHHRGPLNKASWPKITQR